MLMYLSWKSKHNILSKGKLDYSEERKEVLGREKLTCK